MMHCSFYVTRLVFCAGLITPAVCPEQQDGCAGVHSSAVIPLVTAHAERAARHLRVLFAGEKKVTVLAEEETNSVRVEAPPRLLNRARAVLRRLDVRKDFKVVQTKSAEALQTAVILKILFRDELDVLFVTDEDRPRILIQASEETTKEIEACFERLDR